MIDHLLEELLAGRLTPERAAANSGLTSAEIKDLVPSLDGQLLKQRGQEDRDSLILLGRFNLALAENAGESALLAQTCFTLSQLLPPVPEHVQERVDLTERALPILEAQKQDPTLMAQVYYHACTAYGHLLQFLSGEPDKRRAIELGDLSLARDAESEVLPDALRCELHTILGTFLNELDGATHGQLRESMAHLRTALELARKSGNRRTIGMVLNNLGNSLLMLGESTRDEATLQEAARVLEEALAYRDGADAARTRGNLHRVEEAMRALQNPDAAPRARNDELAGDSVQSVEKMLKWLMRQDGLSEEKRDGTRRVAVESCSKGLVAPDSGPGDEVCGRAMLAIAVTVDMGPSTGDSALAVCFGRAAERYFESCGNKPRLAATHFNLGKALSTVTGTSRELSYLQLAADCFEKSWHEHEELGLAEPALQSLLHLAACYKLMGENGDPEAGRRGDELFDLAKRQ